MTNEIEKLRDELERRIDPKRIMSGEHMEEASPCGRYRLIIDAFATEHSAVAVAEVRSVESGDVLVRIRRNDDLVFYAWISREHDYLVLSEDLEGQSIADLTERKLAGFSEKDGGFIWCEFYPSPDRSKIAIGGCFWACSYSVIVYDFREPMKLPLPVLGEFWIPPGNTSFGEWLSEQSFTVKDGHGKEHVFNLADQRERAK